jgi:hypothetical protein
MKKIIPVLILTLIFLSGCMGGAVSNNQLSQNILVYDGPQFFTVNGSLTSPFAFAQDKCRGGYKLLTSYARGGYMLYDFMCSQTPEAKTPIQPPHAHSSAPPQASNASFDDAKKKCADLGFKAGTEAFGNCVLRLSK